MRLYFALFLLLIFSTAAHATTYWASTSGNDSNSCATASGSSAQTTTAKRSIGAGVNCLSVGDTLMVRGGTYNETPNSGHPPTGNSWNAGGYTRIASYSGEVVTITGGNPIDVYSFGGYVEIDGSGGGVCGVTNGTCGFIFIGTGIGMAGPVGHLRIKNIELKNSLTNPPGVFTSDSTNQNSGGLELYNSKIHDNGANTNDNCVYIQTANSIVEGNLIYNCTGAGIQWQHGDTSNGIARNNVIHDVTNSPIDWQGLPDGRIQGIIMGDGNNLQVYNNVIYHMRKTSNPGVAYSGGGIYLYHGQSGYRIYNNTITDGAAYCIELDQAAAAVSFQNNICYGNDLGLAYVNSAQGPLNQTSTFTANPLFVSSANFHLQSGSTAIGAGTALPTCPGSAWCADADGVSRPQGAGWDAGSFEFVQTTPLPVVTITQPAGCTGTSTACTITTSTVNLNGSTTQSGGTIAWVNDRGGSGTATAAASWTFLGITLKSGINNIRVTGTDGTGNAGFDDIAITYAPTFPGDALVLALGLEDGSGTTATDSSGNSNTGTLVNTPTWVTTGRFGKALLFNGINQYIRVTDANSLRLTQSFTISAWVQPSASLTTFKAVVYKDAGGLNSPYQLYGITGSFGGCTAGGYAGLVTVNGASGPEYVACSSPPLQTGVWTHIAVTYDNAAGQLKLYRMGVLVQTISASGYMEPSTVTSPLDLRIGGSEFGENWQGLIDEVRVYNKALPITAASNTVAGAACTQTNFTDNTAVATASIVGNMNCPIINLTPPSQFKLSAGATELKIGSSATGAKIGANP